MHRDVDNITTWDQGDSRCGFPQQNFQRITISLGEQIDRQRFLLWIFAAEFPPDDLLRRISCWLRVTWDWEILENDNLRSGRFLLWISAAEFPDDNNFPRRAVRQAEILAVDFRRRISPTFCDSVCRFTLPTFVALLLTRWRVACTKLLPIGNGDPDDDVPAWVERQQAAFSTGGRTQARIVPTAWTIQDFLCSPGRALPVAYLAGLIVITPRTQRYQRCRPCWGSRRRRSQVPEACVRCGVHSVSPA